jgi:hypothetical protein
VTYLVAVFIGAGCAIVGVTLGGSIAPRFEEWLERRRFRREEMERCEYVECRRKSLDFLRGTW